MPPVDPNEPMMTGENSFIRLSPDGGKNMSDRTSHWRVLWCPAGAGHTLFVQSTLTDNKVRIYSDNIAVARWLQKNIETLLFSGLRRHRAAGDVGGVRARGGRARRRRRRSPPPTRGSPLTWYDCIDPFVLHAPPGFNDRPIGVFSTFFPARSAQLEINGKVAHRQRVAGDAGRPARLERVSRLVGNLGEAARASAAAAASRAPPAARPAAPDGGAQGLASRAPYRPCGCRGSRGSCPPRPSTRRAHPSAGLLPPLGLVAVGTAAPDAPRATTFAAPAAAGRARRTRGSSPGALIGRGAAPPQGQTRGARGALRTRSRIMATKAGCVPTVAARARRRPRRGRARRPRCRGSHRTSR